jgi:L-2,4-diaminobutyrate transaminase
MPSHSSAFLHPFSAPLSEGEPPARVMRSAAGCSIRDTTGKEFLDAAAGLWCVNVGYGERRIADAIGRQSAELSYTHCFNNYSNEAAETLSQLILERAPPNMQRVFFGNSGSDANDTNIKLVWFYNNLRGLPRKKKIIARRRAYHGVTIVAGSCTGLPSVHGHFDLPLPGFLHVSAPDIYREAPEGEAAERAYTTRLCEELEQTIVEQDPSTVAAFIAEPVMGTGGVLPPPAGYLAAIKEVLDRYDVRLILDEVITGFGRLGTWFGAQYYAVAPDLMTVAKGLTSGYLPLSASLVGERIWEVLGNKVPEFKTFNHGYTYSGHPVAAAAGVANLRVLEEDDLLPKAAKRGEYLLRRLRETVGAHPLVGNIRGVGLMCGVELSARREECKPFDAALGVAGRVSRAAADLGLLVRGLPTNDTIALSPPFVVSEAEIDTMTQRLRSSLDRVAADLARERLWSA